MTRLTRHGTTMTVAELRQHNPRFFKPTQMTQVLKKLISGALLFGIHAAGQNLVQHPAPTGLACAARMPIPNYRGVIWQARVSGSAQVTITIGPGGTISAVEVRSSQSVLAAWLKARLRGVTMLDSCAGQIVEVNFAYLLRGDPSADPQNEITLIGSNTFEVIAHPPIPFTHAN